MLKFKKLTVVEAISANSHELFGKVNDRIVIPLNFTSIVRISLIIINLLYTNIAFPQFDTVFTYPKNKQLKVIDTIMMKHVYKDSFAILLPALHALSKEKDDYQLKIMDEIYRLRQESLSEGFDLKKACQRFYQLLNIAKIKKDTVLIVTMSGRFGQIVRDFSYAKSISYYKIALEYFYSIDSSLVDMDIGRLELDVAAYYYYLDEYDEALAILANCKYAHTTNYNGMGCYDLWSQICLKQKNYTCSREKIYHAFNIYRQCDTNSWSFNGWDGIFTGNLGKVDFYEKNYQNAIPLLKEGMRITAEALMFDNVSAFSILLAKCYIQLQKQHLAFQLLPEIRSALHRNINFNPQFFVDYFTLCLILSTGLENTQQNLLYFDSLRIYEEKVLSWKNKDLKSKEDMAIELASQQFFQKELENKISKQKQIRNIIIGAIIIIALFAIRAIYLKQKQLMNQKKLTHEISEKAELEITSAREELSRFKEFLIEKNRQIVTLESSLNSKEIIQDVEELKFSVILTDEDWIKFKTLFGRVYPNYMEQLKARFPQLTQSEIRYFMLIKLELSNKEMAAILGIGISAMRTIKSRIVKKLQLSEDTKLIELIS